MTEPDRPNEKRMKLRYAGTCRLCDTPLAAGVEAIYERRTKTVRCLECPPAKAKSPPTESTVIEPGTPGASARREFERRHAKRGERIRANHPRLGELILGLSSDPHSTTAWNAGALGEERLGQRLNDLASDTVRVLHDRRIPGTRANIDHIAVTAPGLYVIDAKRYVGKRPTRRIEGGLFRPRVEKLLVGGRDRTGLVDGVLKQVDGVRAVVGLDEPVTGVLCFIESDWPLVRGAFTTRDVEVLWPKKLYPRLTCDGPHAARVPELHRALAARLVAS